MSFIFKCTYCLKKLPATSRGGGGVDGECRGKFEHSDLPGCSWFSLLSLRLGAGEEN